MPSGLSFNYIGFSSTTDDVEFSDDNGASFTYTPTPVGGVDPAITDVRLNPKGIFNGMNDAVNVPSFNIRFRVEIN